MHTTRLKYGVCLVPSGCVVNNKGRSLRSPLGAHLDRKGEANRSIKSIKIRKDQEYRNQNKLTYFISIFRTYCLGTQSQVEQPSKAARSIAHSFPVAEVNQETPSQFTQTFNENRQTTNVSEDSI